MRPQIVTRAIVLSRTDFGEADRIICVLTPDNGKVSLMVKGARRPKSKLAGGIELFSVSDVTYIPGRKEVGTLVSSRLRVYHRHIVSDINRTMLGYELLKRIKRVTEDAAGGEYFELIAASLEGLDELSIESELIEFWFTLQLLKITGHSPELSKDTNKKPLNEDSLYSFDFDKMAFQPASNGSFGADHIKLLRLGITASPIQLSRVEGAEQYIDACLGLSQTMLGRYVRI